RRPAGHRRRARRRQRCSDRAGPACAAAISFLAIVRRRGLDDDTELLAGVVSLLGDELVGADGPPVADDTPASPLAPGILLPRRVVRIDHALADVVHGLIARDLPPAAGHVVQPPGVRLPGLDLQRRLEAVGPAAVLALVLLGKRWVGRPHAGGVFPL